MNKSNRTKLNRSKTMASASGWLGGHRINIMILGCCIFVQISTTQAYSSGSSFSSSAASQPSQNHHRYTSSSSSSSSSSSFPLTSSSLTVGSTIHFSNDGDSGESQVLPVRRGIVTDDHVGDVDDDHDNGGLYQTNSRDYLSSSNIDSLNRLRRKSSSSSFAYARQPQKSQHDLYEAVESQLHFQQTPTRSNSYSSSSSSSSPNDWVVSDEDTISSLSRGVSNDPNTFRLSSSNRNNLNWNNKPSSTNRINFSSSRPSSVRNTAANIDSQQSSLDLDTISHIRHRGKRSPLPSSLSSGAYYLLESPSSLPQQSQHYQQQQQQIEPRMFSISSPLPGYTGNSYGGYGGGGYGSGGYKEDNCVYHTIVNGDSEVLLRKIFPIRLRGRTLVRHCIPPLPHPNDPRYKVLLRGNNQSSFGNVQVSMKV